MASLRFNPHGLHFAECFGEGYTLRPGRLPEVPDPRDEWDESLMESSNAQDHPKHARAA